MTNKKKTILFITGTRADYGKLKPLMQVVDSMPSHELQIFATGMHMLSLYGRTVIEVERSGFSHVYKYINQRHGDTMDVILAKTIFGLSDYVKENRPDLIVVHGDRVESLAGAIVGSMNQILVGHIEGGEVSGTIDDLIRHSVTKLAQFHFVSNNDARECLMQMGEKDSSIVVIGSPDLDVMRSSTLPSIADVKSRYGIAFEKYAIFMFHPVTTELESLPGQCRNIVDAAIESEDNFVVIYPNNDHGSEIIFSEINRFRDNPRFVLFPSMRFECFLTLLKNSKYILGNSSAGVREMPFYGVPSINVGTRQNGRAKASTIVNSNIEKLEIIQAIESAPHIRRGRSTEFGEGNSSEMFKAVLEEGYIWDVPTQKSFVKRLAGH